MAAAEPRPTAADGVLEHSKITNDRSGVATDRRLLGSQIVLPDPGCMTRGDIYNPGDAEETWHPMVFEVTMIAPTGEALLVSYSPKSQR